MRLGYSQAQAQTMVMAQPTVAPRLQAAALKGWSGPTDLTQLT
jgi:hypothetical protein